MNKTILLVVFCFSLFVSGYSQEIRFDSYPSHPRLLVKKGEEQKITWAMRRSDHDACAGI